VAAGVRLCRAGDLRGQLVNIHSLPSCPGTVST
jgi:hypothetical protein